MSELPKTYLIGSARFEAPPLAPGLYVVATPIGNLKDITIRALETLAAADLVLCEDTRHSATLLDHYGIRAEKRSLHEHNERQRVDEVVAAIASGRAVAQISDAGTPLLSDPGFPLVRAVRDAGLPVFAVPGASALLAALASAGLPTDAFGFIGFLPSKAGQRSAALLALKRRMDTLIFYESPRRLGDTLNAMATIFGELRPAAVALELTKRFERVERGTLGDLADQFDEADTKGEAVIVVGGAETLVVEDEVWQAALKIALVNQPLRTAVDEITERFGLKRRDVYHAALAFKPTE